MGSDDSAFKREDITVGLVRRLIAEQFPQWADLPIRPVAFDGWDNRTFHLGAGMSVRLPSAQWYVAQVEKEHRWLPRLAPHLPLPIPVPIAQGVPGAGYPWPWSIYRWLPGDPATVARIADLPAFARALAQFLTALERIDPAGGPPPGPHNFYRGGPLPVYDAETRQTIVALDGEIDAAAATAVWEAALRATWHGPPVWVHGDVASGNLLVTEGRLGAVIDFGCLGVGDPACDLTIAWTFLSGKSREVFRAGMAMDSATWARARGWALWKALITLAPILSTGAAKAAEQRRIIEDVLAEHQRAGYRSDPGDKR
jgi:aminoglycoside phosphotransferase (APT) family kinase protein